MLCGAILFSIFLLVAMLAFACRPEKNGLTARDERQLQDLSRWDEWRQ